MGEPEPRRPGLTAEGGPAAPVAVEGLVDHRLPAAVAVQAGALLVLNLEDLEDMGPLVRGRHDPQIPPLVRQDHARGPHVEEFHAPLSQHVQKLDNVKARDQRIGKLHEHPRQPFFPAHRSALTPYRHPCPTRGCNASHATGPSPWTESRGVVDQGGGLPHPQPVGVDDFFAELQFPGINANHRNIARPPAFGAGVFETNLR